MFAGIRKPCSIILFQHIFFSVSQDGGDMVVIKWNAPRTRKKISLCVKNLFKVRQSTSGYYHSPSNVSLRYMCESNHF